MISQEALLKLLAEHIAANPEVTERAAKVTTAEELAAFAKAEGTDLSAEIAAKLLPQFLALTAGDGKLADDALDAVAGGGPGPGDHETQSC